MAAAPPQPVKVTDSLAAVRRVREFLAAQGYLGEIASRLLFVVRVERLRSGGREYYEIVARLPEMGSDGRLRVRTYRFRVDVATGDVVGEPVDEVEAATRHGPVVQAA